MNKKNNELIEYYNQINNSFSKKMIYHVGVAAGLMAEIGAMMQVMLYCYCNQIKFILYADDCNFGNENGWNTFFEPFCEVNHDRLNHNGNFWCKVTIHPKRYWIKQTLIKWRNKVDFLSEEIHSKCIPRSYSQHEHVTWETFGINGTPFDEFGKLGKIAFCYNVSTQKRIQEKIDSLNLPDNYVSIQLRGGDKTLEFENLLEVDFALSVIEKSGVCVKDIFIFTDDYKYIEEVREKRSNWNIYTLTKEDENGYNNGNFNKKEWKDKEDQYIKLFSMIEICIQSSVHFGNEQTCVNNYIRSVKSKSQYIGCFEN